MKDYEGMVAPNYGVRRADVQPPSSQEAAEAWTRLQNVLLESAAHEIRTQMAARRLARPNSLPVGSVAVTISLRHLEFPDA